jgi:hypothetical protein
MSEIRANLDFDEEAEKLFASLGVEIGERGVSKYNNLDPIWKHPDTAGTLYVGNRVAAAEMSILAQHGITHVVNCTFGASKIPNFHQGRLSYYTFPVSHWPQFVNSEASCLQFVNALFDFIDTALRGGNSVLIHCLAGAHRAGTTGCLCLMKYADLNFIKAVKMAKQLRPIIDPIGQLPELLVGYEKARQSEKAVAEKT